jgi:2-dehydropantoate 2-reductase
MRIAIVGAGGLGGYFGAKLAAAGEDVIFIARGKHLAALRERGLTVRSEATGDVHLALVEATNDPATAGIADLVIITVKRWDTESVAEQIKPMLGPKTAVISLQNGVDKDDIIGRIVGPDRMIGGIAYISAAITEPGVITHNGALARLVFGETTGKPSARTDAFLAACRRAGINAAISDDIRRETWEKFVFVVGLSSTTSLMRSTIGPIRTNEGVRRLLQLSMEEIVTIARARGIKIDEKFADDRMAFIDTLPRHFTSSMLTDLEHGNRLELPWLGGAVTALGAPYGIGALVNDFMANALSIYVNGNGPKGETAIDVLGVLARAQHASAK